jgi:hypothetical protein
MRVTGSHVVVVRFVTSVLLLGAVVVFAPSRASATAGRSTISQQILDLTGGRHARFVVTRGVKNNTWALVVFDTQEGRERLLAPETTAFRPFITPNGRRVIFDDFYGKETGAPEPWRIWVVDWNGRNLRPIVEGKSAEGVAEDPPGTERVYYLDKFPGGILWRAQIDNPSVKERVWTKSSSTFKWGISRDGKRGITGCPWPSVMVAELPDGKQTPVGGGCGQNIASDDKRCVHLINLPGTNHGGIMLYDVAGGPGRTIDLRHGPDMNMSAVMCPDFARNDDRFLVMTGPQSGQGPNKGNLKNASLLFAKFNAGYTGIEGWVKLTDSPTVDVVARCWIGNPDEKPSITGRLADQTVDEGQQATFTVEATGYPEPTYQWQQNGADIPGATGASCVVTATRSNGGATFRCIVTNAKGSARSSEARLIVNLKGPGAEVVEEWDRTFLARLRDALKAGTNPALSPGTARNRRTVLSIDTRGTLNVEMGPGMQVGMPLARLTADEKVALMLSVLDEKKESDHCLVGFYLFMAGKDEDADRELKKGGKGAEAVRALFR